MLWNRGIKEHKMETQTSASLLSTSHHCLYWFHSYSKLTQSHTNFWKQTFAVKKTKQTQLNS